MHTSHRSSSQGEGAGSSFWGSDASSPQVSWTDQIIFAIKFRDLHDLNEDVTLDITRIVHKTDKNKVYVVADLYGIKEMRDDDENGDQDFCGEDSMLVGGGDDEDEGEDDEDCCSICLTEKKAVCLLPCRHFCVCESCFQHIDKCPHCRQQYSTYLIIK